MIDRHLYVLLIYTVFLVVASLLALARRWLRPRSIVASVWKKYPTYILLNLTFLLAAWLPHRLHALALLLAVIAGIVSWEISRALDLSMLERWMLPVATTGLIIIAEWVALAPFIKIWLATLLGGVVATTLGGPQDRLGRRVVGLASCLVYTPMCLVSLLWLWHTDEGDFRAVFLYFVIAANDAFAQIIGQLIGRHYLAPHISPSKTIEGAVGGLLIAATLGASLSSTIGWSVIPGAVMGIVIGLAGLIGDLIESGWKRALGLKDFSPLLGVHGGVLDRFDALIFAAPIFFLFVEV
jgi:phosphatidate cytidylyltransferase